MKTMLKSFTITIASFVMLSVSTQAQATSSTVVLNLEGNPTCDSLGDNSSILMARDNDPQVVGVNEVSGPRIDGMVQTIAYSIDTSGALPLVSWEILNQDEFVNPINYVILKAQGNNGARVFHFGGIGAGEVSDTDEESRGNIAAVSFCYGLTEGPIVEPPLAGIPDCGELGNNLGGTLIGACPTDSSGNPDPSQKRLLISMDLDADNFDIQSCTCNVPGGLPSCDPNVPVDEPGACIVTDQGDPSEGVNERVPVIIQGVETPNSYICFTIGGDRFCFGDF